MSYIPDCRTDETYNEKFLGHNDREYVSGYDFCVKQALNALDNLDAWDDRGELDVRPSDIEKTLKAFREFQKMWLEIARNELIASLINSMSKEEYAANVSAESAETGPDNNGPETP